ncbi:MAG: electron transfer flavoprotein subunit beta/FixA family protein [candidate division Zixibacteria bacterium]|nr:electron transfer flavoprotein subunit beta/FixA family protein [candidate division Zixibacteria bacterium]
MNTVVLIKQVPEIELVRVDEAAGSVTLPSGPGIVNPFDEYAIEEALKIRESNGGKVIALTLGSDRGVSALRQALSVGVDEAILVTDETFVGSDQMATAKILAAAINKIGEVNLVLAGKQAIDDDAAVVPAALAANLDWPQVLFVRKTESISDSEAIFQRVTEDGYDSVATALPAVVSVVKEINEPRLPSLKGKMKAKKTKIETWAASDIGISAATVGANSPTKTLKAAAPPPRQQGELIEGETPDEIAAKLVQKLRDDQAI